jgi:hypothetical protein
MELGHRWISKVYIYGLHVYSCTDWLRSRIPPPLPRIWALLRGRYWSGKIDNIFFWPPGLHHSLSRVQNLKTVSLPVICCFIQYFKVFPCSPGPNKHFLLPQFKTQLSLLKDLSKWKYYWFTKAKLLTMTFACSSTVYILLWLYTCTIVFYIVML